MGSPLPGFVRRLVTLVIFLVLGLIALGLLGSGPLLEIIISLLLNSGR